MGVGREQRSLRITNQCVCPSPIIIQLVLTRSGELPAVKNGSTWVSRFGNIVDYVRQYSNGAWDLDAGLGELEQADNIAYVRLSSQG